MLLLLFAMFWWQRSHYLVWVPGLVWLVRWQNTGVWFSFDENYTELTCVFKRPDWVLCWSLKHHSKVITEFLYLKTKAVQYSSSLRGPVLLLWYSSCSTRDSGDPASLRKSLPVRCLMTFSPSYIFVPCTQGGSTSNFSLAPWISNFTGNLLPLCRGTKAKAAGNSVYWLCVFSLFVLLPDHK